MKDDLRTAEAVPWTLLAPATCNLHATALGCDATHSYSHRDDKLAVPEPLPQRQIVTHRQQGDRPRPIAMQDARRCVQTAAWPARRRPRREAPKWKSFSIPKLDSAPHFHPRPRPNSRSSPPPPPHRIPFLCSQLRDLSLRGRSFVHGRGHGPRSGVFCGTDQAGRSGRRQDTKISETPIELDGYKGVALEAENPLIHTSTRIFLWATPSISRWSHLLSPATTPIQPVSRFVPPDPAHAEIASAQPLACAIPGRTARIRQRCLPSALQASGISLSK